MTSTSFNVGLTDNTRLSSRVLRPPGGGHTDIFGGEPEPPRGRRPAPAAAAQSQSSIGEPVNGVEVPCENGQQNKLDVVQENKVEVAQGDAPKAAAEPPKAEAPKRVRVPPGGFSSGLW